MKTKKMVILVVLVFLASGGASAASELKQNYPNPFTAQTAIRFVLDDPQKVCLNVYDLRGGRIATLCNGEEFSADSHDVVWDGKDASGKKAPDGIYFFRIEAGSLKETRKMILIR